MTASKAFLLISLAFIGGIFLDSVIRFPRIPLSGILFFGVVLTPVLLWQRRMLVLAITLFLVFFAIGIYRHQIVLSEITNNQLKKYNDLERNTILEGIIIEEPIAKSDQLRIVLEVNTINNSPENENLGRVLITADRYPDYHYGERLKIEGKLKTPPIFEGFNYQNYLVKDGIYSVISWPKITISRQNGGNSLYKLFFSLKERLRESLNRSLSLPQSAILEALLFGEEENLPQAWKDKLNLTGTRHITAVSGMNITIITFILVNLLLAIGLWRNQALYFSVLLIFFYILMVGAPASAVRAGIMATIFLFAQYFGRLSSASRAIIFAGALMLIQNPLLLTLDMGFQLSFSAMFGLIYLQPFLASLFKNIPNTFQLRSALSATIAAQIFTFPLLVYNFGRIPLLSPFSNILIVPLLSPITILGFVSAFLGLLSEVLGAVLSWFVWLPLTYLIMLIDFFSKISFASLVLENVSWPWLLLSYLLLGYFVWKLKGRRRLRFLED